HDVPKPLNRDCERVRQPCGKRVEERSNRREVSRKRRGPGVERRDPGRSWHASPESSYPIDVGHCDIVAAERYRRIPRTSDTNAGPPRDPAGSEGANGKSDKTAGADRRN